jgi:hypothetical protein
LDEPDAHLHPSLAKRLIQVLQEAFVERFGTRVILTTHSPSTVAFTPEESLFEVKAGTLDRISKLRPVWRGVTILTDGVLTVGPGTKFVFTEASEDQAFYSVVRDILLQADDLPRYPSLVFLSASGDSPEKKKPDSRGGSSKVRTWLRWMGDNPHVYGLIDRDRSSEPEGQIQFGRRNEMENYLVDPLILHPFLVIEGQELDIPDVRRVGPGTPLTGLRDWPEEELQRVVNAYVSFVRENVTEAVRLNLSDETPVEVEWSNGSKLVYPAWFLDEKGTHLIGIFRKLSKRIENPSLICTTNLLV